MAAMAFAADAVAVIGDAEATSVTVVDGDVILTLWAAVTAVAVVGERTENVLASTLEEAMLSPTAVVALPDPDVRDPPVNDMLTAEIVLPAENKTLFVVGAVPAAVSAAEVKVAVSVVTGHDI